MGKEQGLFLAGPDGLVKRLTESVLETALHEELTEHLGHEKHQAPSDRDGGGIRGEGCHAFVMLSRRTVRRILC